jgi:hypothetical protein
MSEPGRLCIVRISVAAVLSGLALQMIAFFETRTAPELMVQWDASAHERDHVDENEDDLELGRLRDRRTISCGRILPASSRRAEAGLT